MLRIIMLAFVSAICSSLLMAQAPPQPSDFKSVADKLSEEINNGLAWRSRAIAAEAKVKELQAAVDKCPKQEGGKAK